MNGSQAWKLFRSLFILGFLILCFHVLVTKDTASGAIIPISIANASQRCPSGYPVNCGSYCCQGARVCCSTGTGCCCPAGYLDCGVNCCPKGYAYYCSSNQKCYPTIEARAMKCEGVTADCE